MQMTAFTSQYGRYVLNNLIESLDKPYLRARSLGHRSDAALHGAGRDPLPATTPARPSGPAPRGGAGPEGTRQIVGDLADRIILDDRFKTIDVYLTQALLYLQCDEPADQGPRSEVPPLRGPHAHDRQLLAASSPCTYPTCPHWVIQRLGELMWALEGVPLILCVDQLEDMFDMDDCADAVPALLATLCDIVSRHPSAIVVISCLQDYYTSSKSISSGPPGPNSRQRGPGRSEGACERR